MKLANIVLWLMAFSFGYIMLAQPELWYFAGLNLLFAITIWMDSKAITMLKAKLELQRALLDAAAVIMIAKDRAAAIAADKKERAGPWE